MEILSTSIQIEIECDCGEVDFVEVEEMSEVSGICIRCNKHYTIYLDEPVIE
jgi:hypothetical protein